MEDDAIESLSEMLNYSLPRIRDRLAKFKEKQLSKRVSKAIDLLTSVYCKMLEKDINFDIRFIFKE